MSLCCLLLLQPARWLHVAPASTLVARCSRGTLVARCSRGTLVARCSRGTLVARCSRGTLVARCSNQYAGCTLLQGYAGCTLLEPVRWLHVAPGYVQPDSRNQCKETENGIIRSGNTPRNF